MRGAILGILLLASACAEPTVSDQLDADDMMASVDAMVAPDAVDSLDAGGSPPDANPTLDVMVSLHDASILADSQLVSDAALVDRDMRIDIPDAALPDMMDVDGALPDMMVVDMMPLPRCDDGVQNGEDTGIDCGGSVWHVHLCLKPYTQLPTNAPCAIP